MGELYIVSALRDKRAEIAGAIIGLEKELSRRRTDLMHLDATLRLFAPGLEPKASSQEDRSGAIPGSGRANAHGWCWHCFEPRTARWRRGKSLTA